MIAITLPDGKLHSSNLVAPSGFPNLPFPLSEEKSHQTHKPTATSQSPPIPRGPPGGGHGRRLAGPWQFSG